MQRLTFAAAAFALLAGGIFWVWNPVPALRAPHPDHMRGISPASTSPESGHLLSLERPASQETGDPFQIQARQLAAMPPDTARENAVRDLAQAWAKEAPRDAERWARGLEGPAERECALTQVCLQVAASDPRDAIRIAETSGLHQGIVQAAASQWAAMDFEAALSWARGLPEGEARDSIQLQLIQVRAAGAPAEAAAMLSESALSRRAHEEAALAILNQWFLADAKAAREWVDGLPDDPVRERALTEIQGMASRREQMEVSR